MKRTPATFIAPVAVLLVGLTGMLDSGLARAQTQPVTAVGPVASPISLTPQELLFLQQLALQQQLRITSVPQVPVTQPTVPVAVPAAVTAGGVLQPTTVVLAPSASASTAVRPPTPIPTPNFFTQGADATAVPTQGPAADWFTNGASVLTVPSTTFQ